MRTDLYRTVQRFTERIAHARRSLKRHISFVVRRTRLTTYFYDVLKHIAIEREISDERLEARVFFPELAQLADFWRTETSEALLPSVKGCFGDSELSCYFSDRGADLGLSKSGRICSSEQRDFRTSGPPSFRSVRRIFQYSWTKNLRGSPTSLLETQSSVGSGASTQQHDKLDARFQANAESRLASRVQTALSSPCRRRTE